MSEMPAEEHLAGLLPNQLEFMLRLKAWRRSHLQRKEFVAMKKSSQLIQRLFRGWKLRKELSATMLASKQGRGLIFMKHRQQPGVTRSVSQNAAARARWADGSKAAKSTRQLGQLLSSVHREGEEEFEKDVAVEKGYLASGQLTTELTAGELATVAYHDQADPEMYSKEALKRRAALRRSKDITDAVKLWWDALAGGEKGGKQNNAIGKSQYMLMNVNIHLYLVPEEDDDWFAQAEADWKEDARGKTHMPFRIFFDAVFELADVWCTTTDEAEYVQFVTNMFHGMTEGGRFKPVDGIPDHYGWCVECQGGGHSSCSGGKSCMCTTCAADKSNWCASCKEGRHHLCTGEIPSMQPNGNGGQLDGSG
eukprot:CAMPEP_0182899062 /NCGR_PEP_ID=MMETSP0034_2-20130328/27852_1 /TAXON_ID=156128 /ORGANISM="Nephroselmis pyriformis, Strain CCMP717" /LENGTH=364 /DNA_ID=CAMNT_0025033059 /DNA_START=252 /DNA_END=1343 /DNA_ORIENTATION=-